MFSLDMNESFGFNLVKDLDDALQNCKNKNEFINYFQTRDYEIKFTNKNITFKKKGEKKGIRADTLAKQFGQKYSKNNIENKLNIENSDNINSDKEEQKKTDYDNKEKFQIPNYDYYNQIAARNWKRYEKRFGKRVIIRNKQFSNPNIFSKNPLIFTLRLIRYILNRTQKPKQKRIVKNYSNAFRNRSFVDFKNGKRIVGNIPYRTIVDTLGEAVQIKLYSWQITKLLNNRILLSSKIDLKTGTAIVTLKKTDLKRVEAVLNVPFGSFESQAKLIENRKIMSELKRKNPKLSYLLVTPEQAESLKEHCVLFASYKKGDKINIAFSPEDKERVLNVLYPNREDKKVNKETFFKRNTVINRKLKEKSAETGEKLCYKIVLSNQYKLLRNTTLEFAVFRTDQGKYNVVFLESQKAAIEKALNAFVPKSPNINQNPKINL